MDNKITSLITRDIMKSLREDGTLGKGATSRTSKPVSKVVPGTSAFPSASEAERMKRKRSRTVSECDLQAKKNAVSREKSMIDHIRKAPVTLTLGDKETEIYREILDKGGATETSKKMLAEGRKKMHGKERVVDFGYTYSHLSGTHKETADTALQWARGKLATFATFIPDFIFQKGFRTIVVPLMRISSGEVDPKSLEGVCIKGAEELSASSIKHLIGLVKHIDESKAGDQRNSEDIEKLFSLLREMICENRIPEDHDSLVVSDCPVSTFRGKDGIFAIQGSATLPNGEVQPFEVIHIRSGSESAFLLQIGLAKTDTDPVGTLVPVLFCMDTEGVDDILDIIKKYGVVDMSDLSICEVKFTDSGNR